MPYNPSIKFELMPDIGILITKAVSSSMNIPSFGSSSSSARSSLARSSSSSSAALLTEYDVFLSFRGPDARSFVNLLDAALRQKDVSTFLDDRLEPGKDILIGIREAINHSRCSIVVFSENFADSEWCMDELVMIHERMIHKSSYKVFPVFYHVDSDHVQRLTGSYEEAFVKLKEKFPIDKVKVSKCVVATIEIAKISGWDLQNRNERDFIQEIVRGIVSHLRKTPSDNIATEGASDGVDDQNPEETSNRRPQDIVYGNLESAQTGSHLGRWHHCAVFFVILLFIFGLVTATLCIVFKERWI